MFLRWLRVVFVKFCNPILNSRNKFLDCSYNNGFIFTRSLHIFNYFHNEQLIILFSIFSWKMIHCNLFHIRLFLFFNFHMYSVRNEFKALASVNGRGGREVMITFFVLNWSESLVVDFFFNFQNGGISHQNMNPFFIFEKSYLGSLVPWFWDENTW